ncbi:uncharacterized protein DFL_002660 [Arthrobotrys flagrans]|uniref:FFD box profile domain-containing protein n=1 Tax=Arthrobotrys flagrans TaxID=97331 RepID=A0A437AB43_ARTFL|nr:hypothetical protein DFL_002660 [Arthrobotrys flagrans]
MSEFIGSRISLVSRSDIRYVGTLHQIDSENSTVGLENVTNHGTEGRCDDPANEVDGTDEIYDYIVFRGSDVKDLRMEAPEAAPKPPPPQPSFPNDPAIINAQRPPGYPPAPQFNYQQNGRPGPGQPPFNPNFTPGFYPPPGPGPMGRAGPGGQFYPQPPYMAGFPGGPGGPGFPGGSFPYGVPPFPPGPQAPGQAPPPGDNRNRAATQTGAQPQPAPAPGPAPPQAKVDLPVTAAESKDTAPEPKGAVPTQQPPPPPLESKPDVATALAQPTAAAPTQPTGLRNAGTRGRGARGRGAFGSSQPGHTQTGTTITATTTTITPSVPVAQSAPAPVQPASDSPGLADLERKVQAMKLKQTNGTNQPYRQNNNGPAQYRGRGRGRGGMPHQSRKVDVPTTDYDFELANARFTKVADSEDGASAADVPEGSAERKPSVDQPAIIAPAGGFYNKGSSFFDNISCENKERAEAKEAGADGRPGVQRRSEEVRKNIETFGQGSVDSGYRRGNWRGRGRGRGHYRGRGRGGGQQQQQQQTQPQSQPVKASS